MSLGQADVGHTAKNVGRTAQNVGRTRVISAATRLMFVKDQRGAWCAPQGPRPQGWMGKTQPGLTHPVKTGLNHTEKPTKVGKIGFY